MGLGPGNSIQYAIHNGIIQCELTGDGIIWPEKSLGWLAVTHQS